MSFRSYSPLNTCLCKWLKSHVSVHTRTVKHVKVSQTLMESARNSLITFTHPSGKISVGKSLC